MDYNIKYSKITKEKLKEYYEENLSTKVDTLEFFFYGIFQFIRFFGWVCLTAYFASNHNLLMREILKKLEYNKYFFIFELISLVFYFIILPMIWFKLTNILMKYIFKNTYKKQEEGFIIRELEKYNFLLDFQELLESRTIKNFRTNGYSDLTIEYHNKNGLIVSKTINIEDNYKKTVKEEYIDFTWVDDKINAILKENKCKEINLEEP